MYKINVMAQAKKRGRPKSKVTKVTNEETKIQQEPVFIPGRYPRHLVYVDGKPQHYTESSIQVLLSQNSDTGSNRKIKTVEFPRGTRYEIPEHLKGGCNGCG